MRTNFRQEEPPTNDPVAVRVGYEPSPAKSLAAGSLLAAIEFGSASRRELSAGLSIAVELEPLNGAPCTELWFAQGEVRTGHRGIVRYAHDDHFLFAAVEVDERQHGDVRSATETVYAAIRAFQNDSEFSYLLRMWNFLDAVNEGEGDLERYRQFCVGRAQGLADASAERYPAATAIGRHRRTHQLQVFWLAGRAKGVAVENPRQVSAYRYPRAHGPVSPSFSRATVTADGTLLISGTASIVGHVSQHPGDPLAQLEETLRNLDALIERAGQHRRPGAERGPMLLKVYVRDPAHVDAIAARLRAAFPDDEIIFLAADICRRELLLEIECVMGTERSG